MLTNVLLLQTPASTNAKISLAALCAFVPKATPRYGSSGMRTQFYVTFSLVVLISAIFAFLCYMVLLVSVDLVTCYKDDY